MATSEAVIDAGEVLDQRERERDRRRGSEGEVGTGEAEVDGSRGAAQLKGARRPWPVGGRAFFVLSGLVIAAIVTALLMKARHVRREDEVRKQEVAGSRIEKHVPDLKLTTPVALRAPPAAAPATSDRVEQPGPAGTEAPRVPTEAELLQERRLARGFGGQEGENGSTGNGGPPPGPGAAPATLSGSGGVGGAPVPVKGAGGLEEKLEAVELKAASAGMLPDRDYLLTQGAMLDCALETKVISTVAGMTSCHLTRNIYSTNGHVVLLDRGSKVVGRYQGGAQQGDARIFVVWTRIETPSGIVVELQSPGTGPLGEAGLGGWIDTHFWDRFGAAIMLSIIQDGTDAAAARASGPGQGPGLTFSNQAAAGKEVVAKSMEPTINIPPTLYKNQGERVGIFVARDLDFRSVYGLERVARAER